MLGQESEPKQTVMVVEDDQIISALLKHMLARRGFEVYVATDGRQASTMVEELIPPPRLVMLDVILPFVDGFDLITLIRSKQAWKDVPIIMLTSKAQEQNIVRALDAGATDYVVKPFQPEELMARVRRLVK
ncbi:MAG: response regulator transcription factor [Pyrinomonadaceae bacterium]|nr:response regulator transcription factor [Pyrinomonadaceae bacterium]